MKKYLAYLFSFITAFACTSQQDQYALFERSQFAKEVMTLSIDKVPTLEKFNQAYWAKNSLKIHSLILVPYDFHKQRFGDSTTSTFIPLSALSWSASLHRNSVEFYPDAQGKIYDVHKNPLSNNEVKKQFIAHLLNRGKNPKLAERPTKAWVDIFMPPQQSLQSLTPLLGLLADAYTEGLASDDSLSPSVIKNLLYLRKIEKIKTE